MDIQQLQALVAGHGANPNLIYNRYQRSDYTVGTDNLNPQRELNLTDAEMWEDIDNMRARLYGMYRERLEQMRRQEGTLANVASDLGIPYDDRETVETPFMLQESATAIGEPYSPNQDLEKMIGALSGLLGDEVMTMDDLPFDICAGLIDDFDQHIAGTYDALRQRGQGTGNQENGGTGTGASGVGRGSSDSAIQDDLACFVEELGLLRILMALVEFMRRLAMIQQRILAIVFLIIRAATLIAQAWVNPSAIAELVQELANAGIAAAAEVLQQVIKTIWDALDLDCLMKQSLASVRELMGSVGVVTDAGAQAKSFLQLNNRALGEIERTRRLVSDAFKSKSLEEVLKDSWNAAVDSAASTTLGALNSMQAVRKIRAAKAGLARAWKGATTTTEEIVSGITTEALQTSAHIAGAGSAIGTSTRAAALRVQASTLEDQAARGYYHERNDEGQIINTVHLNEQEREQRLADAMSARQEADQLALQQTEDEESEATTRAAIESSIEPIANAISQARQASQSTAADTLQQNRRVSESATNLFESLEEFIAVNKY